MSSSTTSSLTRYRPVIYSIAGLAATYSIYLLYSTLQTPAAPGLHRTNAVHHTSRDRDAIRRRHAQRASGEDRALITRLWSAAGRDHGVMQIDSTETANGERMDIQLTYGHTPSIQQLRQILRDPNSAAEVLRALEDLFIDLLLHQEFSTEEMRDFTPVERFELWDFLAHDLHLRMDDDRFRSFMLRFFSHFLDEPLALEYTDNAMAQLAQRTNHPTPLPNADGSADAREPPGEAETIAGTEVSFHTTAEMAQQLDEGNDIKTMLYYIAEDQARQEGYIHRGVTCNRCSVYPIRGTRWRCMNCPDWDLCSECEATGGHARTHVFVKIRIPAPDIGPARMLRNPIYPGKPQLLRNSLPNDIRKKLSASLKFEQDEVIALYDQFTCLANTPWPDDPNGLGGALDRIAFHKSFVPFTSRGSIGPNNLLYNQIFALYDSDADGLIGFEEFLRGLTLTQRRGGSRSEKIDRLRVVFKCFDIDHNDYVSRKDFLRIFRAYHAIQMEVARDLLVVNEQQREEEGDSGRETLLRSSQPLSSAFSTNPSFPNADRSAPRNKVPDRFGDLRVEQEDEDEGVVLDNAEDEEKREDIIVRSALENNPLSNAHPDEMDEASGKILHERWRRREFYTDEEEGMGEPEGYASENAAEDEEEEGDDKLGSEHEGKEDDIRPILNNGGTPSARSRSSSKVRFQDDVEWEETRSNASSASRPVNERWGGYEIPEPEKDFGRDVLYQLSQQGFNELLDPVFKAREELGMLVRKFAKERKKWSSEIERQLKETFTTEPPKLEDIEKYLAEEKWHEVVDRTSSTDEPQQTEEEKTSSSFLHPSDSLLQDIAREIFNDTTTRSQDYPPPSLQENIDLVEQSVREEDNIDTLLSRLGMASETDANGGSAQAEYQARALSYNRRSDRESSGYSTGPPDSPVDAQHGRNDRDDSDRTKDENELSTAAGSKSEEITSPYNVTDGTGLIAASALSLLESFVESPDQTWPQFRPNSVADIPPANDNPHEEPTHLSDEEWERRCFGAGAYADVLNAALSHGASSSQQNSAPNPSDPHSASPNARHTKDANGKAKPSHHKDPPKAPSEQRLRDLMFLELVSRVDAHRGGPGRLNFAEFQRIMEQDEEGALDFIVGWLDVGSF